MKILIATGLYPPDIGGPATYTVFLEKHLPQFGYTYEVVAFSLVRHFPPVVRHFVYLVKLIRSARHSDVLYALDTVSVGLPTLIASILTRTPYLLRVPGDYAWEQGSIRFGITETLDEYLTHTNRHWRVRFLAWIQKSVASRAVHIVVPSDYMKGVVASWGITKEKITRVYSALKTIVVSESRDTLRARLGYKEFVVLSAGRLVPWKGMIVLIDTVAMLRARGMEISLHIIGDGVEHQHLEERIHTRKAEAYVHLEGACTRETLAERIVAADVFVLNTAYEGLSHILVEVMSLGTPIITTPVGGNTELLNEDDSGLFVPYNNVEALDAALTKLKQNTEYGRHLTIHAKEKVIQFHEDKIISEFINVIKTV